MLKFDTIEFKAWQTKQTNNILFFDGALWGNPGTTSAGGGVVYKLKGQLVINYAWGLGSLTDDGA